MKKRIGFVSNSSSTSFCIMGVCVEESELLDLNVTEEIKKKIISYAKKHYDFEGDDWVEAKKVSIEADGLSEFLYSAGITHYGDWENSVVYIGNEITNIKDDETWGHFKERTKEKLNSLLGDNDYMPEIICKTIYD